MQVEGVSIGEDVVGEDNHHCLNRKINKLRRSAKAKQGGADGGTSVVMGDGRVERGDVRGEESGGGGEVSGLEVFNQIK